MNSLLKSLVAITMTASLLGCATVDFDYPKQESVALENTDMVDTYLGKQLGGLTNAHPDGESGFLPLADGIDALAVRLILAKRAERTIDAQHNISCRSPNWKRFWKSRS